MMQTLCRRIDMPEEVTREVLRWHLDPDFHPDLSQLTREGTWDEGLKELTDTLGNDPLGIKQLCCMLRCALDAKVEFEKLGLSDAIYYDTMGCFSRFVQEHMESYGCHGFNRGFWTVRQISCKLFRIGQLEYELVTREGRPVISLHIPTDVHLETGLLRQSWEEAMALLAAVFPAYAGAPVYCHSWLLSPTLKDLLPPESNIRRFQASFEITALPTPCTGVIQWVFKNPKLPPEKYPENTSLQRKLKAYLLGGSSFTDAKGFLIPSPFRTEPDMQKY